MESWRQEKTQVIAELLSGLGKSRHAIGKT